MYITRQFDGKDVADLWKFNAAMAEATENEVVIKESANQHFCWVIFKLKHLEQFWPAEENPDLGLKVIIYGAVLIIMHRRVEDVEKYLREKFNF